MYHLVDNPQAPPDIPRTSSLADEAWQFHRSLPNYAPTPLRELPGLARELGIGALHLKDESPRFGLNAFKGLGASFAIHKWLAQHPDAGDVTFTTATDGNHGRAVAWTARLLGKRAVIFIPAHTVPARLDAIRREGAEIVLVEEGYDAAVAMAHEAARRHGWIVIQDTAQAGYEEIPRWIGAGYWTHARELEATLLRTGSSPVDLVLLHAGVGTWAAAMVEYFWLRYSTLRPKLVIVEPIAADCVLASARAGHAVAATGSLHTIMAGLNCGWPSSLALPTLIHSTDALIAIEDVWAERAMRRLATPVSGDPLVVSGESGAASLAGLLALLQDEGLVPARHALGVGASTRVLLWSTEGATDPEGWARVVGRPVPA